MPDAPRNLTLDLLRTDDFLALTFEFVNLTLDQGGGVPRLVRKQPGDATIIVRLPPQHIAEQNFPAETVQTLPSLPVACTLAEPTVLVFRVPASMASLPLTTESLLQWTQFDLVPAGTAGEAAQTAIELPFRLVWSPDASAGWMHATKPVARATGSTSSIRVELWHTRLGLRSGSVVDTRRGPPIRAIRTRETDPNIPHDLSGSALDRTTRMAVASADASGVQVNRLMLSAIGAWGDLAAATPAITWRQRVAAGRDTVVHITQEGILAPFRHRALLVKEVHRRLEPTADGKQLVECLVKQDRVVVLQPVQDFGSAFFVQHYGDTQGREMPLQQVEVTTVQTPTITNGSSHSFVPETASGPVMFHMHALDRDGRPVDFSMPLMFIPIPEAEQGLAQYSLQPESIRQCQMRGQAVAFAPSGDRPASTHLNTDNLLFTTKRYASTTGLTFLPMMERATVSIPVIDRLLASSGVRTAPDILFHDAYLAHGFDPVDNRAEAFMRLLGNPVDLTVPAERAGGIAAPSLKLDGLSRALGPLSQIDNQVAAARQIAPGAVPSLAEIVQAIVQSLEGHLLGWIPLNKIVASAVDSVAGQIPKLLTTHLPDEVVTTLEWSPSVAAVRVPPLVTFDGSAGPATLLQIKTEMRAPLAAGAQGEALAGREPTFIVEGKLENFALEIAEMVRIDFDRLRFRAEKGKKVDLSPEGVRVAFIKELAFLDQLARIMPVDGFSDPPSLEVTPEGITAGYSLGIPSAGIGVFSIENIGLSAALSLPLVGAKPAAIRIGFSERFHPFLVTLSFVGGGGFVSLDVSSKKIEALEASLEIGGNVTVSFVIVEANAHVMMGFYFGLKNGDSDNPVMDFSAYIRVGASVDILGIISVSVEFYLGLTYTPKNAQTPPGAVGEIGGIASLVVGIHLLFVDKSFSLTFERHFFIAGRASGTALEGGGMPGDPTFDDMVTGSDWATYCRAFA